MYRNNRSGQGEACTAHVPKSRQETAVYTCVQLYQNASHMETDDDGSLVIRNTVELLRLVITKCLSLNVGSHGQANFGDISYS